MARVVLRIKNPQQAREAIDEALVGAFDQIEKIAAEEAAEAVLRIQFEGFGPETTPTSLRVRSGDALASMGSETTRPEKFRVVTEFGALRADPEIEQYLTVQEEGMTITPLYAEKLAFPPGDAGPPIRDERGVQLFWASEFNEVADEYGFAAVIWTENSVVGRRHGSRELEVLFVRREFVEIKPRRVIGRQESVVVDGITRRINAELRR